MNSAKKTATVSSVCKLLLNNNSFAIFAHTNPDGDTLGSCVALALALRSLGKTANLFCDMLPDAKLCNSFEEIGQFSQKFFGKYDMFVSVDCGDIFRLGEFASLYDNFGETLTLDHHGGEYFSKYNLVTNYASTSQIIFEVVKQLSVPIDDKLATYLYMGLCTDTGNFSHNNTDKSCFLMASVLCEHNAQMEKVNRVFFKDTTLTETKLLARALSRMRTYYDGKMALMYLTSADLRELGADFSATSGIVQYAINIDTAKAGVMMTEYAPNVFKVSMRGKDFSVRDICREFGGGGHLYAAGCMISGFLEDVIEKIVRVVGYTI